MKTSALIPLVAYLGLAGMSSAAPVQVAEAENHLDKRTFCFFGFGWCNTATTTSAAPAKTSAASSVVISSAAKSSAITSSSAAAKSSAVVVVSSSAKASSVAPIASSVSSAKAVSTSSASKATSANWAQCTDFDWSAWNDKEWTWGGGFSKDYVKDWYLAEYGLAPPVGMNWRQVSSLVSKFGAKTSVSGPKTTSRYSKGCSNPWTSAAVTKTKAATTTTAKPVTTSAVVSKPAVTSAAASVSKASSAVVSSASASPSKAAASSASASVVKPSSSASSAAGPVASSAASSAAGPAASSAASSAAGPAASSAASSAAGPAASSAASSAAGPAVPSAAGPAASSAAASVAGAASSAVVDAVSSSAAQAPAASPSPATPSSDSRSAGNNTGVPGTGAGVPGTGSGTPGSGEGSNNGTSTTVAAPEPTQPAPVTVNGYQYGGCAQEVTGRLLADVQTSSASQTIESCTALCASYGFGVAGLEYGNECYCGTLDDVEDAAISGECNMPCAGNANEICGGPNAINWYIDSDLTPTTVQLPAGWTTYGVVNEGTNGRLLPTLLYSGKDNTVETCAQGCAAAGFKLAGTEYSSECFCGNGFTASAGGGELVDDSAAFMACSGNLAQKCGGPSILSVTSAFGNNIPLV